MEIADRERILNNMELLVDRLIEVDIDLFELCELQKIISTRMRTNIEAKSNDKRERYKLLVNKITQRGPSAYDQFLEICSEHFPAVYQLLNKKVTSYKGELKSLQKIKFKPTNTESIKLEPYLDKINVIDSMNSSNEFCKHNKLERYKMETLDTRGVLFLVNIIEYPGERRNGASQDKKYLLELFHFMGFKIFYYEDITFAEYQTLIDQLIYAGNLENIECLFMAILTYGLNKHNINHISFIDEIPINVEEIYNKFNNVNCTALLNKPKIFLFPSCRGNVSDKGVSGIEHDSAEQKLPNVENPPNVPTISDMIICYATAHGFTAHRDTIQGSWYIKSLYDTFCEHAHDTDLEIMLKMIGAETIKFRTNDFALQTSCYENIGFNKALYFNPGYYGSS